jgi:hypothetical protein
MGSTALGLLLKIRVRISSRGRLVKEEAVIFDSLMITKGWRALMGAVIGMDHRAALKEWIFSFRFSMAGRRHSKFRFSVERLQSRNRE